MVEQRNFLQTGEFSCIHCDFKCDSNDQQKMVAHIHTHSENLVNEAMQATKEHDKRIRAEVLAAVEKHIIKAGNFEAAQDSMSDWLRKEIRSVQPAAKALEELLRPGQELAEAVLAWETAMDVNEVSGENTKRIYDATSLMLEKAHAEGKG